MKTIDGILSLDFDTVIPGHGPVGKKADLIKWKGDFETVRGRMRELARQGKSKEEAASLLKVDDLPGWRLAGLFQKSLPGLYDEVSRAR
jgi:hypothetical protein